MTTATATKISEKILFTGRTHTTAGKDGIARSADGFIDIKLPQPHPAAENLFGIAWSACYMGAIELAAAQRKVKLPTPPVVDAEIDLANAGGSFYLRARLNVTLAGVDHAVAEELAQAAHGICPYSKAVHGNIDVVTNVL